MLSVFSTLYVKLPLFCSYSPNAANYAKYAKHALRQDCQKDTLKHIFFCTSWPAAYGLLFPVMNPEPLAEEPKIVRLRLTGEQVRILEPVLTRQRGRREGALLSVASVSYEPSAGEAIAKLDCAWLPWKLAQKVCRIIREAKEKPREGSDPSIHKRTISPG